MIKRNVEEALQHMYEIGYKKGYEDALKKDKGEWEDVMYDHCTDGIECSKCKERYPWYDRSHYCPNCGDFKG